MLSVVKKNNVANQHAISHYNWYTIGYFTLVLSY